MRYGAGHRPAERWRRAEQHRAAIARALVGRSKLLVLDDPASKLDPDSIALLTGVLSQAVPDGACGVLASGDEALRAICMSWVG